MKTKFKKLSKTWATSESAVFGAFNSSDDLVGTAGIFLRSGKKFSHKAVLWGMYVRQEFRRKGAGRLLVEEALNFAKLTQAQFVDLTVVSENSGAVKLYNAFGFTAWGEEPAALKIDGIFFKELHMSLKIK